MPRLKSKMAPPRVPLVERFHEKVDRRGPDECWPWTASKVRGYGHIAEGAPSCKMLKAHRVAYELQHGSVPEGQKVLHTCDNPPCVNPAHLFLGDHQTNMTDMVEKGRSAAGERQGRTILTDDDAIDIRRDYVRNSRTHGTIALGRKYRVSQHAIGRIVRGETWNG